MASGTRAHSRFLDRYILDNEHVVVENRHHWARLLEPIGTALLGLILVGLATVNAQGQVADVLVMLLWWVWFALLARLAWKALEWRNEWFVATDKRMLKTYGLITHKVAMMPLRKVTDMNYARSPMGRVLGYGQFLLESAGQDQAMRVINWVDDPDQTYRVLCETIFGPGGHDPDDSLVHDPLLDEGMLDEGRSQPPRQPSRWGLTDRSDPDPTGGPGWQTSREAASSYQPIASGYEPVHTWTQRPRLRIGRQRDSETSGGGTGRREVAEDPDITGPIPRP